MQKFLQKYGKIFNQIAEIAEKGKFTEILGLAQLNYLILSIYAVALLVFIDFLKFP